MKATTGTLGDRLPFFYVVLSVFAEIVTDGFNLGWLWKCVIVNIVLVYDHTFSTGDQEKNTFVTFF